jgi:hypothetical protein
MGTWVEAHDESGAEDERVVEPERDEDENVVDFPARRLREWIRGMFGGETNTPRDTD